MAPKRRFLKFVLAIFREYRKVGPVCLIIRNFSFTIFWTYSKVLLKFPTRRYCWIFTVPWWANWCWKSEKTHPPKWKLNKPSQMFWHWKCIIFVKTIKHQGKCKLKIIQAFRFTKITSRKGQKKTLFLSAKRTTLIRKYQTTRKSV